ncbi:cold shock and DUF1294 domain-containing protein [uncultured Psychromonas sp.]|uniref:cold shock and DUF1294 domain-containing protein n=1 Tax=uncultured Psychromonas sp. TaxID=173974 RepID=UPI00260165E5|nr:cold shock and DUF1294 domain-containing protein [uncultured Psychromonas sp.]
MKLQGKVLNWNDDKGFGFVEPNGGGQRAFVHIKSFKYGSKRPINGDVIIYELVKESNNKFKAIEVQFASDAREANKRKKTYNKRSGSRAVTHIFTIAFCVVLVASTVIGKLPIIVIGLYVVMSIIAYIAYAIDKSSAQSGRWRTKESTLHLFALLGGWPGAFYAQQRLRHKSIKEEFQMGFKVTIFLNLIALIWLYTKSGSDFLRVVVMPLLDF